MDVVNALPAQAPYARLIASGLSLVSGFKGQAQLIDIVPNVLYLLGLAIPLRIDGKVVANMFTESYRQQVHIKHIDDEAMLSDEEEGLVVDRLRDLGYLG